MSYAIRAENLELKKEIESLKERIVYLDKLLDHVTKQKDYYKFYWLHDQKDRK